MSDSRSSAKGRSGRPDLTTAPITRSLYRLAWPMFVGMLALTLFNLADTWYVAQLGTAELAAMTFTFPVVMMLNGLTLGIGTGATALISQRWGSGEREQVRKISRDSLLLALTLVLIVTVVGLLTIRPLFSLLGADGELLRLIEQYMTIWYLGAGFVVIPMVGNAAIRGTGDTKTPAMIMTTVAIINILLDPLLIFGIGPFPRMEMAGAALATVIARALSMLAALYILTVRDRLLLFALPKLRELWTHWKQVLVVGGPAALTSVLGPLTFGLLTHIIARFGTASVAAFGAGIRVDMFAMMVPMALGSGLMVFVGQNWGARQYLRVESALRKSMRFVTISSVLVWAVIAALAVPISRLFSDDPGVVPPMVFFLRVAIFGLTGDSLFVIAVSLFNALRRPSQVMLLYVVRLFVFMVPLAWLGSLLAGVEGMFVGVGVGRVLGGVSSWLILRPMRRETRTRAAAVENGTL